jgi:hypothetical protein
LTDRSERPVSYDERMTPSLRRLDGGPLLAIEPSVADGDLVFDGLPAGRYGIRVFAPGRGPATVESTLEEGVEATVAGRFADEARVRLRLVGLGARRAVVRLTSDGQADFPSVVEDPSGRAAPARASVSGVDSVVFVLGPEPLVLGGLEPGKHRVEIVSPELVGAAVEFQAMTGERLEDVDVRAAVK